MSAVDVLAVMDRMFATEAEACSPCAVAIKRLRDGTISARMTFAPGMEPAVGTGATVEDAMRALAVVLGGAA